MSEEFEKIVLKTLTEIKEDVSVLKTEFTELKEDVSTLKTEFTELKEDVSTLKTEFTELKEEVSTLKTEFTELKEDVSTLNKEMTTLKRDVVVLKKHSKDLTDGLSMLTNEVFNNIKPTLKSIDKKVNIMININTARILDGQTRNNQNQNKNHKELMNRFDKYEKNNELEHKRLDYEICKLKV